MIKKMLKTMWLFALGVVLIALAANVSAQEWWWAAVMILVIVYDLVMLHLVEGLST